MFDGLDSTIKVAIYGLTVLHLPTHSSQKWNKNFLKEFLNELDLSDTYYEAFYPLTNKSFDVDEVLSTSSVDSSSDVFLSMIDSAGLNRTDLFIGISVYLRFSGNFDARGRVLLRNLMALAPMSKYLRMAIDLMIQEDLQLAANNIIAEKGDDHAAKSPPSQTMRYLKIGTAAVLTGAVLAVTGGLAAPAIAVALTAMGGATVAASVSTAAMAVLFGTAGAGLASYKMDKRTKGIKEFHIERYPSKAQAGLGSTVLLAVSGFMGSGEDYKRVFGVTPHHMGLKERLVRFYQRFDVERINCAEREAIMYGEKHLMESHCRKLSQKHGRSPLDLEDISGPLTPEETRQQKLAATRVKDALIKETKALDGDCKSSEPVVGDAGDAAGGVEPDFSDLLSRYKVVVARYVSSMLAGPAAKARKKELELLKEIVRKEEEVKEREVMATKSDEAASVTEGCAAILPEDTESCGLSGTTCVAALSLTTHGREDGDEEGGYEGRGGVGTTTGWRTTEDDRSEPVRMPNTEPLSATDAPSYDTHKQGIAAERKIPLSVSVVNEDVAKRHSGPSEEAAAVRSPSSSHQEQQPAPSSSWTSHLTMSSLSPLAYMPHIPTAGLSGLFGSDSAQGKAAQTAKKEEKERLKEEKSAEKEFAIQKMKNDSLISLLEVYWSWSEYSLSPSFDLHLLRWESQLQLDVGKSIVSAWLELGKTAAKDIVVKTFFSALSAAALLPTMAFTITNMVYSLWSLAVLRADQAGVELARALCARPPNSPPVTLVGFSLGGRVIFSCLKTLAEMQFGPLEEHKAKVKTSAVGKEKQPNRGAVSDLGTSISTSFSSLSSSLDFGSSERCNTFSSELSCDDEDDEVDDDDEDDGAAESEASPSSAPILPLKEEVGKETKAAEGAEKGQGQDEERDLRGIVLDAVILGAPLCSTSRHWSQARRMTAGRLINGYSSRDLVLAISYRFQTLKGRIAGITPVPERTCEGVENRDLSPLVASHLDYCTNMMDILETLDLAAPSGSDPETPREPKRMSTRVEAGIISLKASIGVANMLYGVI